MDLKVSLFLRVHWVLSVLAVILVLPYLSRVKWRVKFPARKPVWLLIMAISIPVLYGAPIGYSLAVICKLMAILLGGLAIFAGCSSLAHWAFRGFVIAVWLNTALLLGGFWGLGSAEMMMKDRWGTILNYPGELWRVAITVWVYAAYLLVKRRSLVALTLLASSTLLVYIDGTRTGIILLFAGALYLVFVLAAEAGQLRRAVVVGATGLCIFVGVVAYSGVLSSEAGSEGRGAAGRLSELAGSFEVSGVEGLGAADVVRYQMWWDVQDAIRAHPVWGTGFETTISETVVGSMSVHMTYLQVWADLGILGFAAYVWLVLGWVPWIPAVMRRVRALPDPAQRAIYYNALFLLIAYAVIGVFHPVSTEWTEWILFMIPYALIWQIARLKDALCLNPSPEANS